MQFDLVSPERKLASLEVKSVQIPGSEGDFAAMDNHAAYMTTLRPGIIKINGGDNSEYFVTGGFVEVSSNGTTILAERAIPVSEVTKDFIETERKDLEHELEVTDDESKVLIRKLINDLDLAAKSLNV